MKIKKSSFHPVESLENKPNYKTYYRIESDGTILERVFLDIPDPSDREQVILLHYLQNYSKIFERKPIKFTVISRDKPWDFKLEIETIGIINLEITSIADDQSRFEKVKKEERLTSKSFEEKIPLYELEKLNNIFFKKEIEEIILLHKESKVSKEELVDNPYRRYSTNTFFSEASPEKIPLVAIIREAIEKKHAKNHSEKENTVLLIDNRTLNYEMVDLEEATRDLEEFFTLSPFKEIWFYTGYYSELDGSNYEFSLAPLKTTNEQNLILNQLRRDNPNDKNGVIHL